LIAAGGVFATLALGRPEPLLVSAPFLSALLLCLAFRSRPRYELRLELDRSRAVEGDEVRLRLEAWSLASSFDLALELALPESLGLVESAGAIRLHPGERGASEARIHCLRWGAYRLGGRIQARDPLYGFLQEEVLEPSVELRVYPRPERLRGMVDPLRVQPRLGAHVSRAAGEGLEFAEIREFAPGDRQHAVNWKATARTGRLHVNRFHPERSGDVVLFIDTFVEVAGGGFSTLDLAVRAAIAAALDCNRRRERVGLLTLGGVLRWLPPGMGLRQLYRIVDTLLETELSFTYSWPTVESIPRRTIPQGALVLALTALVDRRTAGILLDLRARGHDVAAVEISPLAMVKPKGEREEVSHGLWRLHRDALRHRYASLGVPVSVWVPGEPFQRPVMELQRSRAGSRLAHA
jgi:uncharacterized protein (DUF58 family)